ncbi:hypothetical protein F4860DRAFT_464492 [Xylaria cubensis]|nr:hypothetical protein F4860DRAFT_464492 [Xylaria cubensis]
MNGSILLGCFHIPFFFVVRQAGFLNVEVKDMSPLVLVAFEAFVVIDPSAIPYIVCIVTLRMIG